MSRRTRLVLVAGGTAAVAGTIVRGRLRRHEPEALPPHEAIFTAYAPGGPYAYWANGPVGWVTARLMPIVETGVYQLAAEMLDLQSDDDLLDIGCGPAGFLAAKARHVRRIVGLDVSETMLRVAERRLADRLAAGTASLVRGSAAELPFADGEFSAVTAVFAPVSHAEAFRVLRPGGRLVFADPDPRRSPSEPASAWGTRRYSEADHRRMFEEAGFTDVTARYRGAAPIAATGDPGGTPPNGPVARVRLWFGHGVAGELFVSGRKPSVPKEAVAAGT